MRNVIHEIRNHLAVATANVEAFHDGVLQPTSQRLRSVLQALEGAALLLNEVPFDPAQRPVLLPAHPRTINVCEVIANAVAALEATAKERHIVFRVLKCKEHVPECREFVGDPARIVEIIYNVVLNAIYYTEAGNEIEVDCRRSAGMLCIMVTDDGPGVHRDDIGHIFEIGFRGAASLHTEGEGVGLSLVKKFVEEQGGTVKVCNVPGHGARFTIRLPGNSEE